MQTNITYSELIIIIMILTSNVKCPRALSMKIVTVKRNLFIKQKCRTPTNNKNCYFLPMLRKKYDYCVTHCVSDDFVFENVKEKNPDSPHHTFKQICLYLI